MLEGPNVLNVQSLIVLLVPLLLVLPAKVVTNYRRMDNHVQKSTAQKDTFSMDTVVFVHWALFTLHSHANHVFNQIAVNAIPFSVLAVKVDTSCKIIPVKLAN